MNLLLLLPAVGEESGEVFGAAEDVGVEVDLDVRLVDGRIGGEEVVVEERGGLVYEETEDDVSGGRVVERGGLGGGGGSGERGRGGGAAEFLGGFGEGFVWERIDTSGCGGGDGGGLVVVVVVAEAFFGV